MVKQVEKSKRCVLRRGRVSHLRIRCIDRVRNLVTRACQYRVKPEESWQGVILFGFAREGLCIICLSNFLLLSTLDV